jgi:hypothetical protein
MERERMARRGKSIVCDCDGCSVAVGEIVGGTLVIHQRHHGEKHTTVVELAELLQLVMEEAQEFESAIAGRCVR